MTVDPGLDNVGVPPEFDWPIHPAADLFPMLDGEELHQLADDIRRRDLQEPVWLWNDPERGMVLLDGRNRIRACAIAGKPVRTREYVGDEPTAHVVSYNLRTRHLTVGQKAAVGHEVLPMLEEEARQRKARAAAEENRRRAASAAAEREKNQPLLSEGPEWADLPTPDLSTSEPVAHEKKQATRARDKAAEVAGTSGRAVAQFKRIAEQAPDLAAKVKTGEMALDRAERIIRDREAEQRRIEQAKAEAAAAAVTTSVDIQHGDFRDVLADLANIDAIITDPPYPHEFIPLLGDLAAWADKVLAPDGVLAVLIGQTYLPEVYRLLDSGRPYRWTGCYLTAGSGYVSHPRRVQSNWKPLIVYGGGKRFSDVIRSEGLDANAKTNHKWGQDYSAFHTIIERLTDRGQTVVDPFMGSGTTLLAAHALGRHAIGCDVDEESVAKSRERVA